MLSTITSKNSLRLKGLAAATRAPAPTSAPAPVARAGIKGPTIFDKLGGRDNVTAVVDKFYEKILADPVTAPFFKNTDMKQQRAKQMSFMMLAFGGPNDYKGRSMGGAHAGLGLTDAHFDAVAGHFVSTLKELGVAEDLVAEATAVVESTRGQVLGRE